MQVRSIVYQGGDEWLRIPAVASPKQIPTENIVVSCHGRDTGQGLISMQVNSTTAKYHDLKGPYIPSPSHPLNPFPKIPITTVNPLPILPPHSPHHYTVQSALAQHVLHQTRQHTTTHNVGL